MLDHLDRGVGSMVDLLEQLEILDNTIIFLPVTMDTATGGTSVDLYIRMILCSKTKVHGQRGNSLQPMKVVCGFPSSSIGKIRLRQEKMTISAPSMMFWQRQPILPVLFHRKQTASVLHRHCSHGQASSKLMNTCTGKTACVRSTHKACA